MDDDDPEEVEVDERVELVDVDEVLLEVDDGVGVGVGVGEGVGFASALTFFASESSELLPPLLSLPIGKTTMRAVDPLGTVTTQKSAPPAPVAALELLTLPTSVPSISQGSPTQGPSHSKRRPKLGGEFL